MAWSRNYFCVGVCAAIPPRNLSWSTEGKWVPLVTAAFENYCIRKMEKDTSEPFCEKAVMGTIGITKSRPS